MSKPSSQPPSPSEPSTTGGSLHDAVTAASAGYPSGAAGADCGAPWPLLPSGGSIGAYRILRVLGEGGFGTVFLAEQKSPRRSVALKVQHAASLSRSAVARFMIETQALARLHHPGIAQIHEAGFFDPVTGAVLADDAIDPRARPFFAMEFIDGRLITEFAAGLETRDRLRLMASVGDAVQHAHAAGIIHRDLKPANILVEPGGGSGQPRILDFGVARVLGQDPPSQTLQTQAGQLIGTLAYMSPEQVGADPHAIDTRSDVYALGVILYEVLAGRLPYDVEGKMVHEVTRTICETEPRRLGSFRRDLAGDIELIALKALEKDKSRRYQTASELAEDIRRFLRDEPITARPPSTVYQLRKFARRNKPLVGGAVTTLLVLIAGIVATTIQAARAQRQRDAARREADKAIAVTGFLEETLASADPDKKGKDVRLADVLDGAASEIETTLAGKPEIAAALHMAIARAYKGLGLFDAAAAQVRLALGALPASRGKDDSDRLEARTLGARIMIEQSLFSDAEAELAAVREARLRRAGGKETPASLHSLSDLAYLYSVSGRLPEAEKAARDAIEGYERLSGMEHDDAVSVMLQLAEILTAADKSDEAEVLFTRVLDIRTRRLPPGDERIQSVREALGNHYRMQGKYAKAVEAHTEMLEVFRSKYGPEHPRTLSRQTDLGKCLQQAGRLDEAESILRPAYEALVRVEGQDHFDTLTCAAFLGDTLQAAGKLEDAERFRRITVEARVRTLGPDHPQTLIGWTNLSLILVDLARFDDARTIVLDLLERRERVYGPEHNEVGVTLAVLGLFALKQNDGAGAEPTYRRCLAIREKALPEGHPIRALTMSSLGYSLALQGKYAEAEPLITRGADGVLADPRSPARNQRDVVDRAVFLYEQWGKPELADLWRTKLQSK